MSKYIFVNLYKICKFAGNFIKDLYICRDITLEY